MEIWSDVNIYCNAEEFNYGSRFKFGITVTRSRSLLLIGKGNIVLDHFVDLNTQLLVHLLSNDPSVDEQSGQETDSHEEKSQKDSLPKTAAFIHCWDLILIFYKSDAFLGRIEQRVTDHLEHLRCLEKTVEVAIIDSSLRVKIYAQFSSIYRSCF